MKKAVIDFVFIPPWGTIFWQKVAGDSKVVSVGAIFIGLVYCFVFTKPDIDQGVHNAKTSAFVQFLILTWAALRLVS